LGVKLLARRRRLGGKAGFHVPFGIEAIVCLRTGNVKVEGAIAMGRRALEVRDDRGHTSVWANDTPTH
jgi:hypothetical protein